MHYRDPSSRLGTGLSCLALIATSILCTTPAAEARITAITVTTTESPTFGGQSFGATGQYERVQGTLSGEVDPANPRNAVIVDIEHAPRNANGTVSYSVDFQILRPIDLSKGNHRIVFEPPNRGIPLMFSYLNSSPSPNNKLTAGNPGNGFLMNQGYTIVEGAWDTTVPVQNPASPLFGVTFPVATNPDGSAIVGAATEEFVIDFTAQPATEPLTYPAATADKSQASLTVRENYGDTPQPVPSSGWDYANASLTAVKLTSGNFGGPGSFGPTALYEFTYRAKNPLVSGLGFAAVRDFATFLRNARTDDAGHANPVAGDVEHIFTFCVSQPCRLMRDFVFLGFNEVESGAAAAGDRDDHDHDGDDRDRHEKVFDGVFNWIGGGDGIFMNYRFAQPFRTHRQHIARWTPEFQFPFANQVITDPVTHKRDGRLARCQATDTCPKIFETNSENEYWAKGGSMLTTDGAGHDLDLDDVPNVRTYFMASHPHAPGTAAGICRQPQNPLLPSQVLRALLVDLDEWVSVGRLPPADRIPRLRDRTLVPALPQAGVGFPNIPGVVYNGIHHTGDLWNFGPEFDEGILTILPPILVGTPYQVFVPKTDADGNDLAGIRVPDIAVPLATYTGWALRAAAAGDPVPIVDGCDASGQRIPFARTKADRQAVGDPRRSLEERYPTHAVYVDLVTASAERLEAQRLLLDADVQAYIAAAQAAAVP
jgi:Alpha/beta hydrolase domain